MVVAIISGEQELSTAIRSHLQQRGWDVVYGLDVTVTETPSLVEAGIDRNTWHIHYQVDPRIHQTLEQLLYREKLTVVSARDKLLTAAADHEEGHWSICPFDRDYAEDILYGISTGLRKSGLSEEEAVRYTPDVANWFMDYIDNTVNAVTNRDRGFDEGIGLFYLHNLRRNPADPGFALFVDAQMKVYGRQSSDIDPPESKLRTAVRSVKRLIGLGDINYDFRSIAEKVPQYTEISADAVRLCKAMLPDSLAEKAYTQGLDLHDQRVVEEELMKRELWPQKAEAFAAVFAPYAKQHCQNPSPGHESEHQGKHDRGRCGFVRKMIEDPEVKKDLVQRALGKGRQASPAGLPYITTQECFEIVYNLRAEEIVLNYFKDAEEPESSGLDLFHLQNRLLEDGEVITGQMNWSRTLFVPRGTDKELWLYRKEVPYQLEEAMIPGRKSIEDILFVIDVSGSMGWSRKPLDGSKYDLAAQSVFGVLKGLEKLGRGAHARYGLILFSDKTEFSGWEGYYSLDKFKRLIFTGYQGGGTHLDPQVMDKALQENRDRFLTLLISDGEIDNTDQAVAVVKKLITAGNDVIQFGMGGGTTFSKKIKKHGAAVVSVRHARDLAGLTLDKVTQRYS